MKSGELRRFHSSVDAADNLDSRNFLVLEVFKPNGGLRKVTILVDGRVLGPWGYPWVKENSEVISAG
jgi:hypothetical protein